MKHLILAAPFVLLVATPALADDRPPTPDERVRIEAALRGEGYTSWGSIELDDNRVWEVDDAIDDEGKEWDLELDTQSLAISKKDD
ncbi:PepSY domain-containing protein [Mesorhizobium australicum]|uniref:Peptidase propeptide and YPEB domain-containing protein n=1 Tax=Mesorhizobium australicum TaxID=536018 RepID=A0A1X7NUP4_9HYPH|nr:PepSY domain-containing protein [Mesorhizobium australicum]SMH41453.1 Peptidase propeptide and YPEB domain-containing protein [Mesorhizobium australicum]